MENFVFPDEIPILKKCKKKLKKEYLTDVYFCVKGR